MLITEIALFNGSSLLLKPVVSKIELSLIQGTKVEVNRDEVEEISTRGKVNT